MLALNVSSYVASKTSFFRVDSSVGFFSGMVFFFSSISLMSSAGLYTLLFNNLTLLSWSFWVRSLMLVL